MPAVYLLAYGDMATGLGFGPRFSDAESDVLPLDQRREFTYLVHVVYVICFLVSQNHVFVHYVIFAYVLYHLSHLVL